MELKELIELAKKDIPSDVLKKNYIYNMQTQQKKIS